MSIQIRNMTKDDFEKMMAEHNELNPDRPIRPDIKEALDNYAEKGWEPGGFLMSVLTNDLFGALGSADSYNRATIFQITSYIYNHLPSNCWGSDEIVNDYIDGFRNSAS